MTSKFDTILAEEFSRSFDEFKETVIRRIGGNAEKTQDIEAIVEFPGEGDGLLTDGRGQLVEFECRLELAAGQDNSMHDTWVVQDRVYQQLGEATGRDGGSQTIFLTRRQGHTTKQPRVRQ